MRLYLYSLLVKGARRKVIQYETCSSNAYLIRAASETIRSMTTSQVLIGSPIS
jgi:hypothetical protein